MIKRMRDEAYQREGLIEMLDYMKASYEKRGYNLALARVVEFGTFLGESAAIFSQYFHTVHTIDPWDEEFMSNVAGERMTINEIRGMFLANTEGCPNIVQYRMPSAIASRMFPDDSVDLVYIDGWHHFSVVSADILTWLPKVRKGGWLGGHDYMSEVNSQVIPAVKATLSSPDRVFGDFSWIKEINV